MIRPLLCALALLVLAPADRARAQTLQECQCASLSTRQTNPDTLRDIAATIALPDLLKDPDILASLIRRHVINRVAEACATGLDNTLSNINEDRVWAIVGNTPAMRQLACERQVRLNHIKKSTPGLIGTLIDETDALGPAPDPASFVPDLFDSRLLDGSIAAGGATGSTLSAPTQFIADLLAAHSFFANAGTAPQAALDRLTPWAFPNWPGTTPLPEMTIADFLIMVNATGSGVISQGALVTDIKDLGLYMAQTQYGLQCLGPKQKYALTPIYPDNSLRLDFDPKAESQTLTRILLGLEKPKPPSNPLDAALAAAGLSLPEGVRSCLATCRDPYAASNQYCEDSCWRLVNTPDTDLGDTTLDFPTYYRPTSPCDAMNWAYGWQCRQQMETELQTRLAACAPQPTISTPDQIDWTTLSGARDCARLAPSLQPKCYQYFYETDPLGTTRSAGREQLLAQCAVRHCGGLAQGTAKPAPTEEDDTRYKEARAASTADRAIYQKAIDTSATELADTYSVEPVRGDDVGGAKKSKSHHLGGALDIEIRRVDGQPATRKDYEAFADKVMSNLPDGSGAQIILEMKMSDHLSYFADLHMVDHAPSRSLLAQTVKAVHPGAQVTGTSVVLGAAGTDAARDIFDKVGTLYYRDFRPQGGSQFFRLSTAPSGTHLHIGRSSKSPNIKHLVPRYE